MLVQSAGFVQFQRTGVKGLFFSEVWIWICVDRGRGGEGAGGPGYLFQVFRK